MAERIERCITFDDATLICGLRSVEYRDGSVCRIINPQRLGGARHCPLKGFVAPNLSPVSPEFRSSR